MPGQGRSVDGVYCTLCDLARTSLAVQAREGQGSTAESTSSRCSESRGKQHKAFTEITYVSGKWMNRLAQTHFL